MEKKFYIVIGDVHGELTLLVDALRRAREFLAGRPAQVIFLGDLIDRGGHENEVLRVVQEEVEAGAILLMGNHDYFLIGTGDRDPREALLWDMNDGYYTCVRMFGHTPAYIPDFSAYRTYAKSKNYNDLQINDFEEKSTLRWHEIIKDSWQYKLLAQGVPYHETSNIFFCHSPQADVKKKLSFRDLLWGDSADYDNVDAIFKVPNQKQMSVHGHFHRLHQWITFPRIHTYQHGGLMKTVVLADSGCGCTNKAGFPGEMHPVIISETSEWARIEAIL